MTAHTTLDYYSTPPHVSVCTDLPLVFVFYFKVDMYALLAS
jgi:hypothetical protein